MLPLVSFRYKDSQRFTCGVSCFSFGMTRSKMNKSGKTSNQNTVFTKEVCIYVSSKVVFCVIEYYSHGYDHND